MRADDPNQPVTAGAPGTFEIWFFVIFEPASRRALWLRYELTHVRGEQPAQGLVWAAVFDDAATPRARYGKRAADLVACRASRSEPLDVRIAESRLREGALEGAVGEGMDRVAWSLRHELAPAPSQRSAPLLDRLPLPMRARHPHTEVRFTGTVEIGGQARELEGAIGVQSHLWGTRRPDEIQWIYATGFDGDPRAFVELACVRAFAGGPSVSFASFASPAARFAGNDLAGAAFGRAVAGARSLVATRRAGKRRLVAHASADADTFAAYAYRDPAGHDLFVAQSDLARVEVELFEASGLGRLRPVHRASAAAGALELHGLAPIPGLRYVAWGDERPGERPNVAQPDVAGLHPPPAGELLPLSRPARLFAAGLTYEAHVRETGSAGEPVLFEKPVSSWSTEGPEVHRPSDDDIASALEAVEPGLAGEIRRRWGFVPLLFDYEVELGVYLLEDADEASLARGDPRVGWFVANDLTLRTCQALGEGTSDPLRFWSVAKGFPGFCAATPAMWIPGPRALDRVPEITLTTTVRGVVRQRARPAELAVPIRTLLAAAARRVGGRLRAGDALLTGTPSGIALQVSPLARAVGAHLFDRFSRVEAAFALYARRPDAFLGPGADVTVDGGFLGSRTVRVV